MEELSEKINYYCVWSRSGDEAKNMRHLRTMVSNLAPGAQFECWSPWRDSNEFSAKEWRMRRRPIFPGYIICATDLRLGKYRMDVWRAADDIFGLLSNGDGSYELRGVDRAFAEWVERQRGHIRPSKVYLGAPDLAPDERVRIISGPMRDLDCTVVSVDRRKTRVKVLIDFLGEKREMTMPIEVVEREKQSEEDLSKASFTDDEDFKKTLSPEEDGTAGEVAEEEPSWFVSEEDY